MIDCDDDILCQYIVTVCYNGKLPRRCHLVPLGTFQYR